MSRKKFDGIAINKSIEILRKNNINYWLDHGSLLGVIRDGKFIDWDNDVDIGVWIQNYAIINKLILDLKNNFKNVSYNILTNSISIRFFEPEFWSIDIVFYKRMENKAVKYYPDMSSVFGKVCGNLISTISNDSSSKVGRGFSLMVRKLLLEIFKLLPVVINQKIELFLLYISPKVINAIEAKFFDETHSIKTIYGELQVPVLSEEYLISRYGMSWRIPVKSWNYIADDKGVIKKSK